MAHAHFENTGTPLTGWKRLVAFLFGNAKTSKHKNKDAQIFAHTESELQHQIKPDSEDRTFTPQQYLLGLVQTTIREGLTRKYSLSGCADIVVLPEKNLYYSSAKLENLKAIFEAPADKIKVSLIDLKKLDNIMDQLTTRSKPLDDLLWSAALYGSKGRLLTGVNLEEIIRLKYWPDIAHLPNYAQNLPIAAFLNGNATDLNTVAEQTETPLPVVYNFYNACETLGFLEKGVPAHIQDKQHAPDKDLYNNISATLGGVRTPEKQQ